ncbi:MAG: oxygen-dependent coproporphyrinogen oxidase [Rickettsiales bacterium]|nr:oxygen-dependent coproporphyrinogen oxidase [Rickettsiales bacterium]
MKNIEDFKKKTESWFQLLRNKICNEIENIEKNNKSSNHIFKKKKWYRNKKNNKSGGGEMALLRGEVFEKAGVNISTVYGNLSKELIGKIPGTEKNPSFWASGISLVIHPRSPSIPAVHMNTRFIVTEKFWFGGGADITPVNKKSESSKALANLFHRSLKKICEDYKKGSYKKYKKFCDDYFYLPHRKETRGLGGIFYDNLNSENWKNDFNFTKKVGENFIEIYKEIVKMSIKTPWTEKDLKLQLERRSRYTEFNLLYDRGTKFGLLTNGNIEAIFMSLPPSASW